MHPSPTPADADLPLGSLPPADDVPLHDEDTRERDACALICAVRKGGQATHGNVKRTIEALARMGHRSGYIDGEGDGVGIMTDIPRQWWAKRLVQRRLRGAIATERTFWVAHLMMPASARGREPRLLEVIGQRITEAGLELLYEQPGDVNAGVLGQKAQQNEPSFWQLAGLGGSVAAEPLEAVLFGLHTALERDLGVHFASFSSHSVVYKVQGTVEVLRRYYPELRDPDYASAIALGHARYSTNTNPIFERVQPFGVLGHNGEFNTISRFRMEAAMLGVPLAAGNSDSQDVDRVLHTLVVERGFDLIEAMELLFPPFEHDLLQNVPDVQAVYAQMRRAFGPFAQGPAALATRHADLCVFSVDALGLRPLWFGETEKEFFVSSERGVYPLDSLAQDPRPLAPGEKVALKVRPGRSVDVLDYPGIQRHVLGRARERGSSLPGVPRVHFWALGDLPVALHPNDPRRTTPSAANWPEGGGARSQAQVALDVLADAPILPMPLPAPRVHTVTLAALGWDRTHVDLTQSLADSGKEPVGSLGWDGPLAALSGTRVNLADYFKEVVAVVTNPSIDRERERAQFSTQVLLGRRPDPYTGPTEHDVLLALDTPLLLGGHTDLGDLAVHRAVAQHHGTHTLDDVLALFGDRATILSISAGPDEHIDAAIVRLQAAAVDAVLDGAQCLLLDDSDALGGQRLWLDPLLAVAAVDRALRAADYAPNLRRRTAVVLRSGALRDLHDLALCVSFGANAVLPYALYAVGLGMAPRGSGPATAEALRDGLMRMMKTLTSGLEKVTSTIGCHELRGYGHAFAAIGLAHGVAGVMGTPNYYGSEGRGLTWGALHADAEARAAELRGETPTRLTNPERMYPKLWKKVEAVAQGDSDWETYDGQLRELEGRLPIALRHVIGVRTPATPSIVQPESVDLSVGSHAMPLLLSAMSFGSQGELAYRAYAEAAYLLNTLCVNGEGGEMADLLGRYPNHRGQQVASARFGVNIALLNSCNLLEIKIGQGAKPGEGGHLPGYKVTEQIAEVRNTAPGVDLISPSNNHDLYSIEDLAQLIEELKNANPRARVSVKVPVVPGVGIIAVGIAKAGADVINLTGYEGGTGAARAHSLRHVGLPVEVGLMLAHRALVESGLRANVELWADGGMKGARDALKMMCLGANRVGYGTMAMVAVGCTICRGCHDGTCHVGITTHVKTREEAELRGFKSFRPFTEKGSSYGIVRVFQALEAELRVLVAGLGVTRAQDLVGRADLLEQIALHDRLDLTPLLRRVPPARVQHPQRGVGLRLTRPRSTLSRQITALVAEHAAQGESEMTYDDEQVMAMDRALGTHLAGALARQEFANADAVEAVHLVFSNSAVPGNGLGAFLDAPLDILVEGGAQDGAVKCARGGRLAVLKGLNHNGQRVDGAVGKSFAYGAQGGLFMVQGNADTRACIRLSGADVIFGGTVAQPLQDDLGGLAARANLKGYACEYMTSGRVLVLGDSGPWLCAGMTGGVVYQRVQPEMNLTVAAIQRRIAAGSLARVFQLDERGVADVRALLSAYIHTLEVNHQADAAQPLYPLLNAPEAHFVMLQAVRQ